MAEIIKALRYVISREKRNPGQKPVKTVSPELPIPRPSGDVADKFNVSPAEASAQILVEGLYWGGKRRLW